jgi:hypothetical protein
VVGSVIVVPTGAASTTRQGLTQFEGISAESAGSRLYTVASNRSGCWPGLPGEMMRRIRDRPRQQLTRLRRLDEGLSFSTDSDSAASRWSTRHGSYPS